MGCDNKGVVSCTFCHSMSLFSEANFTRCFVIKATYSQSVAVFARRHVEDAERRELLEDGLRERSSQDAFETSQREQVNHGTMTHDIFSLQNSQSTARVLQCSRTEFACDNRAHLLFQGEFTSLAQKSISQSIEIQA